MDKLTRQDVFNVVYSHYADGGLPGYDYNAGSCVYFSDDGGHCAVGVLLVHLGFQRDSLLIEGEVETEDLNYEACAFDLINKLDGFTDRLAPEVIAKDGSVPLYRTFLNRMQHAHDMAAEDGDLTDDERRREVMRYLANFATDEHLIVPK